MTRIQVAVAFFNHSLATVLFAPMCSICDNLLPELPSLWRPAIFPAAAWVIPLLCFTVNCGEKNKDQSMLSMQYLGNSLDQSKPHQKLLFSLQRRTWDRTLGRRGRSWRSYSFELAGREAGIPPKNWPLNIWFGFSQETQCRSSLIRCRICSSTFRSFVCRWRNKSHLCYQLTLMPIYLYLVLSEMCPQWHKSSGVFQERLKNLLDDEINKETDLERKI